MPPPALAIALLPVPPAAFAANFASCIAAAAANVCAALRAFFFPEPPLAPLHTGVGISGVPVQLSCRSGVPLSGVFVVAFLGVVFLVFAAPTGCLLPEVGVRPVLLHTMGEANVGGGGGAAAAAA